MQRKQKIEPWVLEASTNVFIIQRHLYSRFRTKFLVCLTHFSFHRENHSHPSRTLIRSQKLDFFMFLVSDATSRTSRPPSWPCSSTLSSRPASTRATSTAWTWWWSCGSAPIRPASTRAPTPCSRCATRGRTWLRGTYANCRTSL